MSDPVDDATLLEWLGAIDAWDRTIDGPSRPERIAYGSHPDQVVDLWLPRADQSAPMVVAIHGGYFMAEFGRDLQTAMVRALVREGYAVCNIEYRRHGRGGSLLETTSDAWQAIDCLVSRLVAPRLAVIGHSAGGFLAEWVAPHGNVEFVVPLGAVTDLARCARSGLDEGAISTWMGGGPDDRPDLYRAGELPPRFPTGAAHVLIHGAKDRVVDIDQSRGFAAIATAAGETCKLVELPEAGHFGFLNPRDPAFDMLSRKLANWRATKDT